MMGNRFIKPNTGKRNGAHWMRQIAILSLCTSLSACIGGKEETVGTVGTIGHVTGFFGGVAADEPNAAIVGRDILSAGGSAADAAVAMYFALSVTLPSSASLGGGGVCIAHNSHGKKTETLDFLSPDNAVNSSGKPRVVAVPGGPRGLISLYSKMGKLKWAGLVAPGEKLARFGTRVSRAFAEDLKTAQKVVLADPQMRSVFAKPDGTLLKEGESFQQLKLAGLLSRLRVKGPGELYTGPFGMSFISEVKSVGGDLEFAELRDFLPTWRGVISIPYSLSFQYQFPDIKGPSSKTAAQMMAMLVHEDRFRETSVEQRPHLLAETGARAFADMHNWYDWKQGSKMPSNALISEQRTEQLMSMYQGGQSVPPAKQGGTGRPSDPTGTSFVTFDRQGNAVACSFTMNGLFGAGRMTPSTGVVLARTAEAGNSGYGSLSVMLMTNRLDSTLYYASAASGGWPAITAMVETTANATMNTDDSLAQAISKPRVHPGGGRGVTYLENITGKEPVEKALISRQHKVEQVGGMGLVHAMFCPTGIREKDVSCSIQTDPRGLGLAMDSN